MNIEVDIDEVDSNDETIDQLTSISFQGTRRDFKELGKFFIKCAEMLPAPRNGNAIQVSQYYLADESLHYKDYEVQICASLDTDES